jgi:hypothetical protein
LLVVFAGKYVVARKLNKKKRNNYLISSIDI